MPDYRGLQECYWGFGFETAGGTANMRMLEPSATAAPAAPSTFNAIGYSSMPQFSINEQPAPIMSLGSYRLFNSYRGIRDYSLRAEITIGNWQFLNMAMRSAAGQYGSSNSLYKGLPVMAIALGSMDTYSSPFNWIARYCMIRELSFSFAPGQPIRATLDFVPLFIELTGASQLALSEENVRMAGGEILGWDNMAWTAGGQDLSHWLEGINISISNGFRPIGQRRNKGDNNPISRVRRTIVPTSEQVSVNYNLAADIEPALMYGGANSTLWGTVTMDAYNNDSGGSSQMLVTIDHNRLANMSMQGGQIGETLNFSASTLSGIVAITGTSTSQISALGS